MLFSYSKGPFFTATRVSVDDGVLNIRKVYSKTDLSIPETKIASEANFPLTNNTRFLKSASRRSGAACAPKARTPLKGKRGENPPQASHCCNRGRRLHKRHCHFSRMKKTPGERWEGAAGRTIRKPESLPVGIAPTDIMLDAIRILGCNRNDGDADKMRKKWSSVGVFSFPAIPLLLL